MKTQQIASRDGVLLSCRCAGSGPPLVLVHGTGGTAMRWTPVFPALQASFSVYALDRRGHGESADAQTYAIEQEFDDIAAVVDSLTEPANLVGHSYGGICSLEAALRTSKLKKLVLYEPPIPLDDIPSYSPGIVERIESLAGQGNREEVVKTFMLDVLRMPVAEFETFRKSPAWQDRLAAAHTLPREIRAHERYRFIPERFRRLKVPTLLLLGGDSSDFFKKGTALLNESLPNSRVVVLPGQRHAAMNTAPELFTREVIAFLKE